MNTHTHPPTAPWGKKEGGRGVAKFNLTDRLSLSTRPPVAGGWVSNASSSTRRKEGRTYLCLGRGGFIRLAPPCKLTSFHCPPPFSRPSCLPWPCFRVHLAVAREPTLLSVVCVCVVGPAAFVGWLNPLCPSLSEILCMGGYAFCLAPSPPVNLFPALPHR